MGGSDERLRRLCGIVVDGKPLGDHPLNRTGSREEAKRIEELQWLGIALVGCDADLEVRELRTLMPRQGKATADFEAAIRSGRRVRLELGRVVFDVERQQNEYFARIAGEAQQILEQTKTYADSGTFIYRSYDPNGTKIGASEASSAAAELASFIENDPRVQRQSVTLYPARDSVRYPTLTRLCVHVCHNEAPGTKVSVMWDPLIQTIDDGSAIAVLQRIQASKSVKVPEYSDGGAFPVWLVFVAHSLRQKFLALATVQALQHTTSIDPRPFARLMVGCFTAGVTFIEPFQQPRYTSLTTTG